MTHRFKVGDTIRSSASFDYLVTRLCADDDYYDLTYTGRKGIMLKGDWREEYASCACEDPSWKLVAPKSKAAKPKSAANPTTSNGLTLVHLRRDT